MDIKAQLSMLLQRPMEPVFMAKGTNRVVMDVPKDYMAPEYQKCYNQLMGKTSTKGFTHMKVKVMNVHPRETFAFAEKIGRNDQFSYFLPVHREIADQMTQIFHNAKSLDDLLSLAVYVRDNLNPDLFAYAFSVAMLHRDDTMAVQMPPVSGWKPSKFFKGDTMDRMTQQLGVMSEFMPPMEEEMVNTASSLDPESRVSYFREDLGVNIHHWKWHLVYPNQGPREIVAKDRRGELFFYMHQQMIARYNAERQSNNLLKVKRLVDFREPIPEAYFPKLGEKSSLKNYPARHANSVLRDIDRKAEGFKFDIGMLEIWRNRIYEAIDTKAVRKKNGTFVPLTEETGMDIIGNLVESSVLSVNEGYYGNLHSSGHIVCGVIHDPFNAYLEGFSVMGDVATACRDPFFYRWHTTIDDICQYYKKTLPQYPDKKLQFAKMEIMELKIEGSTTNSKENVLHTYWQRDGVEVSNGLDFQAVEKPVYLAVTHLQHDNFLYRFKVKNTGERRMGTVRIFMAPTKGEDNNEKCSFNEQRESFIEMDKFFHMFETGENEFERSSLKSSVTVSPEMTFQKFGMPPPKLGDVLGKDEESTYFCGCGWPNHLLVPKGDCNGMKFDLFVMISDYNFDKVGDATVGDVECGAPSFCGIRDKKYPDKQAMGFPFDRTLTTLADKPKTLREFSKRFPNMKIVDIRVKFEDKVMGDTSKWNEAIQASGCPPMS